MRQPGTRRECHSGSLLSATTVGAAISASRALSGGAPTRWRAPRDAPGAIAHRDFPRCCARLRDLAGRRESPERSRRGRRSPRGRSGDARCAWSPRRDADCLRLWDDAGRGGCGRESHCGSSRQGRALTQGGYATPRAEGRSLPASGASSGSARLEGTTTPAETIIWNAASLLRLVCRSWDGGTMSMKPVVGLGAVGTKML